MKLLQSLIVACSMYSKIPMPRIEWNEENMKYAMCFFPVVGVVTGLGVQAVGTFLLASHFGTLFFAGIMTILPILISGGIHMDGFMDTMDARSSYGDREKKLAILKDSHAGAFAILGLGCYLVLSLALWSEVKREMLPVISLGFVMSRSMSGFSVMNFPAARANGLGRTFQDAAQRRNTTCVMLLWFAASGAGMLCVSFWMGGAAILCAAAVFLYYRHVAMKEFGGMTGDLAGYFLVLCELGMLAGVVLSGAALSGVALAGAMPGGGA